MAERRIRVLLLFGGRSAEHDVSRVTAVSVARALDPERYDIVPVGIGTDGSWVFADAAQAALARGRDDLPHALAVEGPPVSDLGELVVRGDTGTVAPSSALAVDVVLPLLHGPYGEDGTVQGLFELADLPYVGSGVVGSAVGMDKIMMKRAFAAAGIADAAPPPVPRRPRPGGVRGRVRARARVPVLREAVEPGLVGGRVEGAATAPSSTPRSTSPSPTTSGSWSRRGSPGGRSRSASSATTRPRRRSRVRSCPATTSTPTPTSTSTRTPRLLIPAPLTDAQADEVRALRGARVRGVPGARRWPGSTSSSTRAARSS